MAEWQQALEQFHLLRPWWLLAIPVGLGILWWRRKQHLSQGSWAKVLNPKWLPFLLEGEQAGRSYNPLWAILIVVASLAMTGPTWQQLPQPVHKNQNALVILLDLSPSMLANDLKPDRLTRAHHKLIDILRSRKEGVTALVVYGGDAHKVSPLTDDTATIESQVSVLHPGLMATPGSNTEAAIEIALTLLKDGGHANGDLLLITDGITEMAIENVNEQLRGQQIRLSIMGVGTADGAPIPLPQGGFAKDRSGDIVVAQLEREPLLKLAIKNGGRYTDLSSGDNDLRYLQQVIDQPIDALHDSSKQLERQFDNWQDQGHWLTLLLLPLAIILFRRGVIITVLLIPLALPQPVNASDEQASSPLANLWKTPDQKGQELFRAEAYAKASQQFESSNWKGSAAYRNSDYETALKAFSQDQSASGLYNQGNTLAHLGKLDEAIAAYEQALQLNPDMADAAANKKLLEELKKQQQAQNQQNQQQQDQSQQNQDGEKNQNQNQNQDTDNNTQQNNSEPSDQQNSPSDQSESTSKQGQEQQLPPEKNQDKEQQTEQPSEQKPEQPPEQTDDEQNQQQGQPQPSAEPRDEKSEEAKQAMEQFLRKVPDDPGAFLRKKFEYQARQRRHHEQWGEPQRDPQQRW